MTLDQAIEILTQVNQNPRTAIRMDFPEASQLGIEALTRLNKMRHKAPQPIYYLLPGETKE